MNIMINELKDALRRNLVAARAYREMRHVEGLTYDVGDDVKFANAMWFGCTANAVSTRKMLLHVSRTATH